MDHTLYIFCQVGVFLLAAGLLNALRIGLRVALQKLHVRPAKRRAFVQLVIAVFVLWLTLLAVVGYSGFFRDFQSFPPRIMLAAFPLMLLGILLLFSRFFGLVLKVIPKSWLIYVQSFRILLELILWLGYHGGFVPPQMTIEWLNYDIIVGATALAGGYVFFARGRDQRSEAVLWNVFGMALLLNVVIIAFFSTPSPFRVFLNDPPNTFVAEVPFIWIPGFFVPFALSMHLFSLKQLLTFPTLKREFKLRRKKKIDVGQHSRK